MIFIGQSNIKNIIKWYHCEKLDDSKSHRREIEFTIKFVNSLIQNLDDENIDFSKLNVEYLIDSIGDKIRKLTMVPKGTCLKSINSINSIFTSDVNYLTKDSYYVVKRCAIYNGYVTV